MTITFLVGAATATETIILSLFADGVLEGIEQFQLDLAVSGATATTGTIGSSATILIQDVSCTYPIFQ